MTIEQFMQIIDQLRKLLDPAGQWLWQTLWAQGHYLFYSNLFWVIIGIIILVFVPKIIKTIKKWFEDDESFDKDGVWGIILGIIYGCLVLIALIEIPINLNWCINFLVNPNYYIYTQIVGMFTK